MSRYDGGHKVRNAVAVVAVSAEDDNSNSIYMKKVRSVGL